MRRFCRSCPLTKRWLPVFLGCRGARQATIGAAETGATFPCSRAAHWKAQLMGMLEALRHTVDRAVLKTAMSVCQG